MLTRAEKISQTKKRNFLLGITKPTCYWKGRKRSEETKQKIRLTLKDTQLSDETKNKISDSLKKAYKEGRKLPVRVVSKTSFRKGNIPWNKDVKGLHLSPKTEFKNGQQSKENNVNWKGGITKINRLIRRMKEFKDWRSAIYKRDNYTCQKCFLKKEVSGKLHPHHIYMLYKIIEEENIKTSQEARECKRLWDIKNGITYCKDCHFNYHGLTKRR